MGALCGMINGANVAAIRAMARALKHRGDCTRMVESDKFVVAGTDMSEAQDGVALLDGQPRDNNPKAGYVVYDADEGTIELRRLEYDIAAVQKKILDAGLPPRLAERLAFGR